MKKLLGLVLVLALTMGMFATVSLAQAEGPLVGCVLISGTIPHCQLFRKGFEDAMLASGGKGVVLDADYDPAALMNAIADFIAMGCDGIVVEACDNQAPLQGIREAAASGIVVSAADMLLDFTQEEGTVISQTVSDNYYGGYMCGQDFVKRANGEKKACCIMEFQTNTAAVQRVQGWLDAISAHDNITVLNVNQPNPENLEQKMAVCDTWIQQYDQIDAIFAYHDPAAMACIASLKAAGRTGTLIYGVDGNEDAIQAIQTGEFTMTAQQNPYELARQSTQDVLDVLAGKKIEHDWLTYVPVTIIDASNAAEFIK
ncbi:MAG: sugar ABC transporter substrate-binding protein [Clostridia bacterium]